MRASQRWWLSFPFWLALASIIFFGWSVWLVIAYPYDGFSASKTWSIVDINPSGPAAEALEVGDVLREVYGVPVEQAVPFYRNIKAGDAVDFSVQRGQAEVMVSFKVSEPPLTEIFRRLIPHLVAIVFWAVGVSVLTFKTPDSAANLFFVFCQISAITLAAGSASTVSSTWVSRLFNISLWVLGPVMVHFHIWFPRPGTSQRRRVLLSVLYGFAILGGLPYIIWDRRTLASATWAPDLQVASLLFFAVNLIIVVLILAYAYRHALTVQTRGKIRIVILGGFMGLMPLTTLTILPTVLFDQPIISNEFAFLSLSVIPLTYGYAIVRHRLIEIEKHVNRGATQVLVYSLIGGIYLILTEGFTLIFASDFFDQRLVNAFVVLLLASIFSPLRQKVQIFVDKAFYGGWYDYRSAVTNITQGLEQITDLRLLASAICKRTQNTLLLENIYLFLTGPKGDLSIYETFGGGEVIYQQAASFPILPENSKLLQHLRDTGGVVDAASIKDALAEESLLEEDLNLLNYEHIRVWVPIFGREKVSGVLALGPKVGGDVFSVDDLYILGVVSRQVGPLIENIHLLTRLRQHAKDLEKRVDERTAELHDAKERVEAILASVGDGVVVTNLNGKIITVNAAFERQTSFHSQEIIGREFFSLINEHNPIDVLENLQLTLQNGDVWIGELLTHRKDGSLWDVQVTMAPVRDQQGRMVGYVGSQRDITQQRELDRLKDQFISDVSHELRTPVTNLSLYLGLLERSAAAKRKEFFSIIRGETKRLTILLEDILDLSRLERKKTSKVELYPLDLNAVTQHVITAHRIVANTSGLDLIFEPDHNIPTILGDENLLARVVTNLVSNAIRYTPSGQVCIRIFQEDSRVCLQVADTGMGIDEEDFPHIFERFYRGRRVSQSKIPGTGLGLAIVKEIIEIHDGDLEVVSEIGKGATVNVWLPTQEVVVWPEKLS